MGNEFNESFDTKPQVASTDFYKGKSSDTTREIEEDIYESDIDAAANVQEELHEDIDIGSEVTQAGDIQKWLGDINPNYDPYDMSSDYNNNCGSCAFAVSQRLDGNTDMVATADNIGTPDEMNEFTGMEQVPMNPDEIKEYLISQGPGSHGIIGIDRAEGPGHWFNAYYDGEKVVAIDGQTGETQDWPPDYGDVTNWDISVRKDKS